jgi:hypothetical protein
MDDDLLRLDIAYERLKTQIKSYEGQAHRFLTARVGERGVEAAMKTWDLVINALGDAQQHMRALNDALEKLPPLEEDDA